MSSKADALADLLALPKGGGAVRGVGEKFSADLHNGTGNFSVPIALPAGRGALKPDLNLVFSTGNGNGPFGLGWSLSVPGVGRLTSKGIPRYQDGPGSQSDIFVLSGGEELVPVAGTAGDMQYRPRTEASFADIRRIQRADTDHWEVRSRDGLVSIYGSPGGGAAAAGGDARAVVADPDRRGHVFAWRLTETRDSFGNRVAYEYLRDRDDTGGHHGEQLYLKCIRYVDLPERAASPFFVSVEFLYDAPLAVGDAVIPPGVTPDVDARVRPDPFSDYRAGFEIRTRRRCKWIVVRTHPTERAQDDVLVSAYEFIYGDELPDAAQASPGNGVSMLARINVVGYRDDGVGVRELPPLDLSYSRFTPQSRRFVALQGRSLPPSSLADPDIELVDLFGDGLPDIVELGGGAPRYWRNLGDGRFDVPRSFGTAPAGLRLSDSGVQLVDADGDGRPDLLVTTNALAGYYPLDFNGRFSARSFQRYRLAPAFSLDDPDVRLIDLTGDGVTDALRSGSSFECYFNHPTEGWTPERTARVARGSPAVFPDVSFADPRVKFADVSGDGLQDIAVIYRGRLDYWPNLGYGRFGKRLTTQIPDGLPDNFDPQRVILGDVDGDGLADLIYVADGAVTLWLNRSGNGWSAPVTIRGTPGVNDMVTVRLADIFGCGVSGLLYTQDAGERSASRHFFLDFTGGTKPYLLTRMDNNLGALTEVSYAPSTRAYLRDAAHPDTRWRTTLPFPVQVVERVTVSDLLSGSRITTEYRYHHGYWDGREREFRGFGMVEQLDTRVFDAYAGRGVPPSAGALEALLAQATYVPPVLTRNWFHQGPVELPDGREWSEFDGSAEYWSGDAAPDALRYIPDGGQAAITHKQGIDAFLRDGLSRAEQRDALRALRGTLLRSEVYALDGSPLQERPYTVTEQAYALREVRPPAGGAAFPLRIFHPVAVARRSTQWERGDDPLSHFEFTGNFDDFGQVGRELAIACPRGWRRWGDQPQERFLATLTLTTRAVPQAQQAYMHDRVIRTRCYELDPLSDATTPRSPRSICDLLGIAEEDTNPKKLVAETLNFYDGPAFGGLDHGRLGDHGLMVRSETLVMTDEILGAAFGTAIPPYLVATVPFAGGDPYPPEFSLSLAEHAGHTYHPRGTASPYAGGWYVQSVRNRFDFQAMPVPAHSCGLLVAQQNALGHITTIEAADYAFRLLPTRVTGPTALIGRADYNLRALQPARVTDPNGNVTEMRYSPSGLVTDTFIRGKPGAGEGDQSQPSVHLEYALRAFFDARRLSPQGPCRPAYVHAVRRVFHDTDPDDDGQTIETREYSDGFGRLLQTRMQAEDTLFVREGAQPESGLVGWWRFAEGQGSTVSDVSGAGNDGALAGEVSRAGDARFGNTLDFAGASGSLWIPHHASLEPVTGTIGMWVKVPALEDADLLMKATTRLVRSGRDVDGMSVIGLRIREYGGVEAFICNDDPATPGKPWRGTQTGTCIEAGRWHHVAMRWDGAELAVFVDGVRQAGSPYLPVPGKGLSYSAGSGVGVGVGTVWGDGQTHEFIGQLAELRFYGRACGDAEIAADAAGVGHKGILFGDDILPLSQADAGGAVAGVAVGPTPRVVVSGWQVFDDKGRAVKKYEPFFDIGWDYQPDRGEPLGQCVQTFYDAPGRAIRTLNPDRSEQRVIHGVPFDLAAPPLTPLDSTRYRPTPWETWTYDANDNAGRTHAGIDPHTTYPHHYDTPASVEVDALGRAVRTIVRHRAPPDAAGHLPPVEEFLTRSSYDIQGNLISSRDALGRLAFEYVLDLAGHPLCTRSIDAGVRGLVVDAAGNPIEERDANGALRLHARDALNRPTRLWARDGANMAVGLREMLSYGDEPEFAAAAADRNQLGRLVRHCDEAGVIHADRYDCEGNLIESSRQVLSDDFLLAPYRAELARSEAERTWVLPAPRIDWTSADAGAVVGPAYASQSAFDALGRTKWSDYPQAANGERYRLCPRYNRAGALDGVSMVGPLDATGQGASQVYVQRIVYNAKGQRTFIAYGNGIATRHAYDPATFRLARMRTERYAIDPSNPLRYVGSGAPLQDMAYWYDLAGNILGIQDMTPGCGVASNADAIFYQGDLALRLSQGDALIRCFEYDPLYRLTSATGREAVNIASPRPSGDLPRDGYNSGAHGTPDQDNAPRLAALYWEEYAYDAAGNMLTLHHNRRVGGNDGGGWQTAWSRRFGMHGRTPDAWRYEVEPHLTGEWNDPPSNRLTHVDNRSSGGGAAGDVPQSHWYDDCGNLIRERVERHFEWDHANRLKSFRNQVDDSRPTTFALYLYDAAGLRVKKLVVNGGSGYRTTTCLGSAFEHHTEQKLDGSEKVENCSLHVQDGKRRIAVVRAGPAFEDDGAGEHPVQYHLADHLGSCGLAVSGSGAWINREEFFPHGETSFGSFGRKRFRFVGKERDEESGFNIHGVRYLSLEIFRWISADPGGPRDDLNLYQYAKLSPVSRSDISGYETPDSPAGGGDCPGGCLRADNRTAMQRSEDDRDYGEFQNAVKAGGWSNPSDFRGFLQIRHPERYYPDLQSPAQNLAYSYASLSGKEDPVAYSKRFASVDGALSGMEGVAKVIESIHENRRQVMSMPRTNKTLSLLGENYAYEYFVSLFGPEHVFKEVTLYLDDGQLRNTGIRYDFAISIPETNTHFLLELTTRTQIALTGPGTGKGPQIMERLSLFQEASQKGDVIWGQSPQGVVGPVNHFEHIYTEYPVFNHQKWTSTTEGRWKTMMEMLRFTVE